jgi:PAS domain S-box-containing protein
VLKHLHRELETVEYVVFTDSCRRYLDCSEGVCRLLGYSRSELLSKSVEDVSFHDKEVPAVFARYLQRGRMEGEYVLRNKNGIPVPIRYQAFVFADGCLGAVWEPIKNWREPYLAALVELDPLKLKQRIEVAYAAIQKRMHEPGQTHEENQDLRDAASALQSLQRTVVP